MVINHLLNGMILQVVGVWGEDPHRSDDVLPQGLGVYKNMYG